jgi:hypothetical protein
MAAMRMRVVPVDTSSSGLLVPDRTVGEVVDAISA